MTHTENHKENITDSAVRAAEVSASESRRRFEQATDHLSERVGGSAQSLSKAKDLLLTPKRLLDDAKASAQRLMETQTVKNVRENPAPYLITAVAIGALAVAGTIFFMRRRQPANLLEMAARKIGKWDF